MYIVRKLAYKGAVFGIAVIMPTFLQCIKVVVVLVVVVVVLPTYTFLVFHDIFRGE